MRTRDDKLPHFMEVGWSYRLRESQLPCKYGGYPNFIRLNINIWRNDGSCGIVNTLALLWSEVGYGKKPIYQNTPSYAFGIDPPFFQAPA